MRYSNFEKMVAPARSKPELWRTFSGAILAIVAAIILSTIAMIILSSATSREWYLVFLSEMELIQTPRATFWALMGFALLIIGIAFSNWLFHERPFKTLFGPTPIVMRDFFRVSGTLAVLFLVLSVLPSPTETEPVQNMEFSRWLILLPLSLVAVLIQVSAEELAFRGYIQSQLAARFSSPIIWMGVPSAIFAFGHYDPASQGQNAWLIVIWAGFFGLIAADLTARSGSLGAAIGLHFVNNVTAIVFTAPMGPLSGLALYTFTFDLSDVEAVRAILPLDFAMMVLGWLAARIAIRR